MRKSVQKALAKQRQQSAQERLDMRPVRSQSKSARKLRKQVIEETFGDVPIR